MMNMLNSYLRFLNTTEGVFFGSFIWSVMPLLFILRNSGYRVKRSFVRTTLFKVVGIPLLAVYLIWALANTVKEVFWYDIQFSSSLLLFALIGVCAFCFTHGYKVLNKSKAHILLKISGYIVVILSFIFLYISYKEFINPTCYYNLKKTPAIFVQSINKAELIIAENLSVFEESTTFPKFVMLKVMFTACPFAVYTNMFCTKKTLVYFIYLSLSVVILLFKILDLICYTTRKTLVSVRKHKERGKAGSDNTETI